MARGRIQQRIDPDLQEDVEHILKAQGIKPTQAIVMFYVEVKRSGGLPFTPTPVLPSEIPNKRLQKELKDARKGKGVETYKSEKELFNALKEL